MANNLYLATKQTLIQTPQFSWLSYFGKTFDEYTTDALTKPPLPTPPPYDAYQVETLLADVSQLLDRCLAYRREFFDLDTTAVRNALDQDLFNKQLNALMDIDMANGIESQRKAERVQHALAVTAFKNDPSNKGFLYLANVGLASDDEAIKSEDQRKIDVKNKWGALQDYQKALAERSIAPGNSFNFVWRAQQVIRFYSEDIREAFLKAQAVQAGLKQIYDLDELKQVYDSNVVVLPDKQAQNVLDGLVQWNRTIIRKLEIFLNNDVQFDCVVLGVEKSQETGLANPSIDPAIYAIEMKDGGAGDLVFDLTNYFPPDTFKFLRVRAVGLSFAHNLAANGTDYNVVRLNRAAALVFPPATPDPYSPTPGVAQSRPPIVLANVTLSDPTTAVNFSKSPTLNNINPVGQWRVKMSKTMGYADANAKSRTPELTDIRLHLKLIAQPDSDYGKWAGYWM